MDFLLPFILFITVNIAFDHYNESKFRFNSIRHKFSFRLGDLERHSSGWITYIPKNKNENVRNFSRIERWYTQFSNLEEVGFLRGIGVPENLEESIKWKDELGILSGHSKIIDEVTMLGVLTGVSVNFLYIFPLLVLVFILMRTKISELDHLQWMMWFCLFLTIFILASVGVWGEISLNNTIQIVLIGLCFYKLKTFAKNIVGENNE